MSESKLQNTGRLYYVEPNDIYNKLPNGIPHPYEDYCISVDLKIEFGDRNSLGPVGKAGGTEAVREIEFSSDNGTINFLGGTNGFLTTNFTDIQSANPKENTNECLGIESINIAYTSWYVPQVTIRFVDVRGASLMSQQEQGYVDTLRDDIRTGHLDDTKINGGSFFKSLFSFPYPLFKLKVKGFYGKEVTYNLSVEDFKSNFNAENGNFETDVRFIGYMFGVYTDIPMNYLMVAPYLNDFGRKYWEDQKNNGRFKYFGTGVPYYTYPELRAKITNIKPDKDNVQGDDDYNKQKRLIQGKIDSLTIIKNHVALILDDIFDGGYEFSKTYKVNNNNEYELVIGNPYSLLGITTNKKHSSESTVQTEFNVEYDKLLNEIRVHNDKYKDEILEVNLNFFGIKNSKFTSITCERNGNFHIRKRTMTIDDGSTYRFSSELEPDVNNVSIDKWVKTRIIKNRYTKSTDAYVCYPVVTEGTVKRTVIPEWLGNLDKKLADLNNELNKIQKEIQKHKDERISKELGFGVSIGNAFNMAFAHMETFMKIFYYYLREIKVQQEAKNRSLSKFKIDVRNTDLPLNFKDDNQIPPFTVFYKNVENDSEGVGNVNVRTGKKKVAVWPGNLDNIDKSALPEINFVNKLIEASKKHSKDVELNEKIVEANAKAMEVSNVEVGSYLATTPYDLTHLGTANPYAYIPSNENGNMQWESMMTTFYLRFFYWYSTHETVPSSKAVSSFAKIEACNMYMANQNITTVGGVLSFLRDRLSASDENLYSEMVSYFSKESTDDDMKVFDIGRGANRHFMINGSTSHTYDWFRDKMPIANVPPTLVDPRNKETVVDITTTDSTGITIDDAYTEDTKMKSDYVDKLVNKVAASPASKEKKVYENEVLPVFTGESYYIGTSTNKKLRSKYQVCVVDEKLFSSHSNNFPRKLNDTMYINTASYSYHVDSVGEETYKHPLFGYDVFYDNLEAIEDREERLKVQACAFALGVPVFRWTKLKLDANELPFYVALKIGAFRYYKENENVQQLLKGICDLSSLNVDSKHAGACLELFNEWSKIDGEFEKIYNTLSLKVKDFRVNGVDPALFGLKSWVAYCKEHDIHKEDMQVLFNGDGLYNGDFYDSKGAVIFNGKSFDLPAKKGSDIQNTLLNNLNRVVLFVDHEKFRNKKVEVSKSEFRNATAKFIGGLRDLYREQLENEKIESQYTEEAYDPSNDDDFKLSTYLTLKNLYDRWISMVKTEKKWMLGTDEESEFTHFKYIDGFYRDIEKTIPVNFEHIVELASQMMASSNVTNDATNTKYFGKSFYEFLASICEKNQMMFLSLPMENEFTDPEGIADMFDVKSYSKMDSRDTSCFVCLYTNKPSQHLDIKFDNDEYLYVNDGFNIANAKGEILQMVDLLPQIVDTNIDGYRIPSFGVTYGKQNQSIFKKIGVNMQNPQVTEASIAATQLIASKRDIGPNMTALHGQDLYRIYSNYSYTCNVEMMGNAQVMPLTYFQLNNIPLFRGAYMIINIEHNIVAGDMTTKFTGVRMSRYELPLVQDEGMFTDPHLQYNEEQAKKYTAADYVGYSAAYADYSGSEHKYTVFKSDLLWSNSIGGEVTVTAIKKNNVDTGETIVSATEINDNLNRLSDFVQMIQDAWTYHCSLNTDKDWSKYDGILITSGYRNMEVNKKVGSKTNTSAHLYGLAVDMQVCMYDTSKKQLNSKRSGRRNGVPTVSREYTEEVFYDFVHNYLTENNLEWDQLIKESSSSGSKWVHFGLMNPKSYTDPDEEPYRHKAFSLKA